MERFYAMKESRSVTSNLLYVLSIVLCLALFSCTDEIEHLESGNLVVSKEGTEALAITLNPFLI